MTVKETIEHLKAFIDGTTECRDDRFDLCGDLIQMCSKIDKNDRGTIKFLNAAVRYVMVGSIEAEAKKLPE